MSKLTFTEAERRMLQCLIERNRDAIDNKRTDATSMCQKRFAWKRITAEYNKSVPDTRSRLPQQLKRLLENMKAKAKKDGIVKSIEIVPEDSSSLQDSVEMSSDRLKEIHEPPLTMSSQRQVANHSRSEGLTTQEQLEQMCSPIIKARLKQYEESLEHQKRLHEIERERLELQVTAMREKLEDERALHILQLTREKEMHEMKIEQEREQHSQRMRHQEELHQLKLADYDKGAYPVLMRH